MKKFLPALAVLAGLGFSHAAFAQHWTTPNNGTISAVMMKDNSVMMKVKLPPAEFQAMSHNMKMGMNNCAIQEIYPGATDTMILVCQSGGN